MKFANQLLVVLPCTLLFSCNVFHPRFDSKKSDTENNRFHYEHLVGIKWTNDVKNLYAYGDELGIDASYYVAFECSQQTSHKIIESNEMIKDSGKGTVLSSGVQFAWWNMNEIDTLTRFVYSNSAQTYFKYYWYNSENGKGYFLDFDL